MTNSNVTYKSKIHVMSKVKDCTGTYLVNLSLTIHLEKKQNKTKQTNKLIKLTFLIKKFDFSYMYMS